MVGYTTGTILAHHFDFGVTNINQKNDIDYLKKQGVELYERDYQSICPYDVFPKDMKQKYYSLFGNVRPSYPIPTLYCK